MSLPVFWTLWKLSLNFECLIINSYLDDVIFVPWLNRLEINNFHISTELFLGELRGFQSHMNLSSPRDDGQIFSGTDSVCLSERNFIVSSGNVFSSQTVENLRLEEDAWVRIADAGQKKSLGLNWSTRNNKLNLKFDFLLKQAFVNLESWSVSKVGLRTLRVVESSVSDGSPRRANSKLSAVKLISRTVSELGSFVD